MKKIEMKMRIKINELTKNKIQKLTESQDFENEVKEKERMKNKHYVIGVMVM